jgi:hypothetical protein
MNTLREEWDNFLTVEHISYENESTYEKIADWWLARLEAQRTADLEAIREGVEKMVYLEKRLSPLTEGITATEAILEQQEQNRKDHYFKKGWQEARLCTLSLIEQIMNKKI